MIINTIPANRGFMRLAGIFNCIISLANVLLSPGNVSEKYKENGSL